MNDPEHFVVDGGGMSVVFEASAVGQRRWVGVALKVVQSTHLVSSISRTFVFGFNVHWESMYLHCTKGHLFKIG